MDNTIYLYCFPPQKGKISEEDICNNNIYKITPQKPYFSLEKKNIGENYE